jgi:hypothetical protein
MDPEDDVRAILTGAAGDTPPMRLEAADVIERGGRIRRRRKRLAVAGTSTATAVILAVAGFLAGHRVGAPDPVQPADPGLSTIGTTAPAPPTTAEVPATSAAPPAAEPERTSSRPSRITTLPPQATSRKAERTSPPSARETGTVAELPTATTKR